MNSLNRATIVLRKTASMGLTEIRMRLALIKQKKTRRVKWALGFTCLTFAVWIASPWCGLVFECAYFRTGVLGGACWMEVSPYYLPQYPPRGFYIPRLPRRLSWAAFASDVEALFFENSPKERDAVQAASVQREAWQALRRDFGLDFPGLYLIAGPRAHRLFVFEFRLWIPVALFLVATAIFIWRDRNWDVGRCSNCGYNREEHKFEVCPECGERALDAETIGDTSNVGAITDD